MSSIRNTKPFGLALIQLGQVTQSKNDNLAHAREMILKAARGDGHIQPRVIILPECFNSPYGVKYFPEYAETIGFAPGEKYNVAESQSQSVKMLSAAAKETGTWLIGGSIPERDVADDKKLYNTATIYSPEGHLVAIHRKVHLFDIDIPGKIIFKESDALSPGNAMTLVDTDVGRIGVGICYDVRFPELAMVAARRGCVAMVYPGAFNLTTGPLHWELLARGRAVDNEIYVAMCSPARDMTADYHAWGHSMIVDPLAVKLAEAEEGETIVFATIDPAAIESARKNIPVTSQRRFDVYPDVSAPAPSR
ncbi:hypothetical protein FRB94_004405 [Tulasnella sp. JGI-2019a]|nr:hypothetical protein FRB94_004405 [Tulasnella sp. JGI-2019a]KAG9036207.1 hypothetical protein FRB95_009570 [Tulasnella sp. JGI-2019a]